MEAINLEYEDTIMYLDEDDDDDSQLAEVYDIKTGKKKDMVHKKYKATMNQYVYPIKTYEEVQAVKEYYLNKTKEEHSKMGWNTKYRDFAIFSIGCSTGLRISDLLNLKYKYLIDRKGEYREGFIICEKKRRKERKVIWTENIIKYFSIYFEHSGINLKRVNPDDYIFTSRQKNKDGSYRLSETNFSHRLKEDLERCIELGLIEDLNYNTHTMRKTFAWYLYVKSGYDIGLVCETLRHTSVDVTMRYLGINKERVDNALRMIDL